VLGWRDVGVGGGLPPEEYRVVGLCFFGCCGVFVVVGWWFRGFVYCCGIGCGGCGVGLRPELALKGQGGGGVASATCLGGCGWGLWSGTGFGCSRRRYRLLPAVWGSPPAARPALPVVRFPQAADCCRLPPAACRLLFVGCGGPVSGTVSRDWWGSVVWDPYELREGAGLPGYRMVGVGGWGWYPGPLHVSWGSGGVWGLGYRFGGLGVGGAVEGEAVVGELAGLEGEGALFADDEHLAAVGAGDAVDAVGGLDDEGAGQVAVAVVVDEFAVEDHEEFEAEVAVEVAVGAGAEVGDVCLGSVGAGLLAGVEPDHVDGLAAGLDVGAPLDPAVGQAAVEQVGEDLDLALLGNVLENRHGVSPRVWCAVCAVVLCGWCGWCGVAVGVCSPWLSAGAGGGVRLPVWWAGGSGHWCGPVEPVVVRPDGLLRFAAPGFRRGRRPGCGAARDGVGRVCGPGGQQPVTSRP